MGWDTSWLGCRLISSCSGKCLAQQPSGSSSQHKPSSATQPFQHTCVAPDKALPHFLPRDAAPRAFLVAVPNLGCSSTFIVVLLTLALTIISMTGAGININHMDIAHIYAGFLLGITNTFGIAAGITAPTAAGLVISQYPQSSWSNSFFLPAALNLFGLIFYTAFGSGTIQDWTEEDPAEEREPQAWEGAQGKGQDLQPPLSSS